MIPFEKMSGCPSFFHVVLLLQRDVEIGLYEAAAAAVDASSTKANVIPLSRGCWREGSFKKGDDDAYMWKEQVVQKSIYHN